MELDLGYQLAYQRGVQAVIWGMPAVGIAKLRDATFRDLGARYNDVVYMSGVTVARHELLTASQQAPYVMVMLNVKEEPAVLDVPAATAAVAFFGNAVDSWMVPIADIVKGGKYLFLPPGHRSPVPAGYLPVPSETFDIHVAIRPLRSATGTLDDVVDFSKQIRAYSLSQAGRPPANRYIDAYPKTWRTLPAYDMSYFETLAQVVNNEPLQERDAAMIGLLATLGIRKGTPFMPEGRLARALELAVRDGRLQMEHYFETPGLAMTPYRPESHWMVANATPHDGATYLVDGKLLIDERAGGYSYWATFLSRSLGKDSFCLRALRDRSGQLLKGTNLYRLRLPRNVPARDFWSVTAYGKESKAYIHNDLDRVGLSSRDTGQLRMNTDGSVDFYFGPQAPAGKMSNWIPTADRDFFLVLRLDGPKEAVFDRSFRLPDVELVR